MALPESWPLREVVCDYRPLDGGDAAGTVVFVPTGSPWIAHSGVTAVPTLITGTVTGGLLSVQVPVTDVAPGLAWTVRETINGMARGDRLVLVPTGDDPLDLSAAAPVVPVTMLGTTVLSVNGIRPDAAGDVTIPGSGGGGVSDHGALTGLGDDDHGQYLTAARGDTRYVQPAALTTGLAGKQNAGSYATTTAVAVRGLQAAGVRQFAAQFGPAGESGAWAVCPVEWRGDPVTASEGDVLDWHISTMSALSNPGGGPGELDLASIDNTASGTPVILRCLSSGTPTPLANGVAGLYQNGGVLRQLNASEPWQVTGADIVDGTVTLALLYRPGASGVTIGHPSLPSRITVLNHGAPS